MSTATPLPTRVNRACDRCRRNKSRCDKDRPCLLCLRASAICQSSNDQADSSRQSTSRGTPQRPVVERATKRRRLDTTSTNDGGIGDHLHDRSRPTSQPTARVSLSPNEDQSFHDGGPESAISIARKIHTMERRSTYDHIVDAIPGADTSPALYSAAGETEANDWTSSSLYLTSPLPDEVTLDVLISEYFDSVHWFSLVILEPQMHTSWQKVRSGFASPGDKCFLLLLSTMLGLAAWYRGQRCSVIDGASRQTWLELSRRMIDNSENQLVWLLDQRSMVALQTLLLLGSYYVYHGRPNLSFSLLGATVKAAQSLGLHQKSSDGSWADREERKRVWSTILTWDRFASINYGRPLGINENGCSVDLPEDVHECPGAMLLNRQERPERICYSPYQRELNRLYQLASPAIESIYVVAGDHHRKAKEYYALVIEVTKQLWRWRRELPNHLQLSLDVDWPVMLSVADRAYKLQSLSLYLTFDSLLLILYRPFMKQRLDAALVGSPDQTFQRPDHPRSAASAAGSDVSPSPGGNQRSVEEASTHEQLWNAAVRTARIAELPQLAQHATDGHLVVFLALNLFNASVILVVMALSDPLSDRAQEAKRAVARIYRVLIALGDRSTLSHQTSGVLRSLIQLLITRESDAIFVPNADEQIGAVGKAQPSIQDALSQPLWMPRSDHVATGTVDGGAQHHDMPALQQGLESVQRAFDISGFDKFDAYASGRSSRASVSNDQNQRPQGSVDQPYHPEPMEQNKNVFDWRDVDDNGMHWIWDPAWDNIFNLSR